MDNVAIADPNNIQPASVKAVDGEEYALEILGVPFGGPDNGRDSQKERFTPATKLHLDKYPKIPLVLAHGLDPETGKPSGTPEYIGTAEYLRTDTRGHWFKGVLDKSKSVIQGLWEAAKKGMLAASSGSINHLVRISKDGTILEWPVAEMTLVDTDSRVRPVNSYAVALPMMKASYQEAGLTLPELVIPSHEDESTITPANEPTGDAEAAKAAQSNGKQAAENNQGDFKMDEKDLLALLDKRDADKAAAAKAQAESEAAIKARAEEIANAKIEEYKAEAAKGRRLPYSEAPHQTQFADTYKYDNLTPGELGLAINFMKSTEHKDGGISPSQSAYKALAIKLLEDKNDFGERDLSPEYSRAAMKAAGMPMDKDAYKGATDPMLTTGTTDGGNWVHTSYVREIWASIRADARIVAKLPSVVIPDGFKSSTFPVEGTDFTWYGVAETTSANATTGVPDATVTASQITTPTNKEVTVAKIGARGMYTGEMTEDSIVAFAPELRRKLSVSGAEQLEHLVIDGDTTTTAYTNINDVGNSSTVTAGTLFLQFDGLRHLALANNSRAGGALDEDDYLETMWLMGTAGLAGADMSKCSFIIDPNVYRASLKMATLKTKDVWTQATMESGVLTKLWGYEILPSWFMHFKSASRKSNSAGKVDQTTVANNAYGAILGVRWDLWKFAYKRQMTMETTRFASSDSWEIVALARVGLGCRDTTGASITYGVQV